mgnify:CR=1 FL=1
MSFKISADFFSASMLGFAQLDRSTTVSISVCIHHCRNAEYHVVETVFPGHQARYRHDRLLIPHDRRADPDYRHRNAVIGCMFFGNDFICAVFHMIEDPRHRIFVVKMSAQLAKIADLQSADTGIAPCCQFTVPVLADDIGMHASAVHIQMLAKLIPAIFRYPERFRSR